MAEIYKINAKNKLLFAVIETTSNTYQAPAATDTLPMLTIDGSITTDTNSYQYLGNALSRAEFSYIKDQYADFTGETPQQILGNLSGSLTVAQVPMSAWFQSCGGFVTVLASSLGNFAAGTVFIDNSQVSNSSLSIDYRLSSAQDTINNKIRQFYGCRGMVDVNASLGEISKLKFTMKGNAYPPIQSTIMNPVVGNQLINVATSIRDLTILNAQIAQADGTTSTFGGTISTITHSANMAIATASAPHSLGANGDIRFITIGGATDATYNGTFMVTIISTTAFIYTMPSIPSADASGTFTAQVGPAAKAFCFSTLTAANFFGFDFARYLTGCETGFSKTATATDVAVDLLESQAPATQITAIASTTTTATATAAGHGLVSGDIINVTKTNSNYNVTGVVATVTDVNTFTYPIPTFSGSFTGTGATAGIITNTTFVKFDPDSHIMNFFGAQVTFGTGPGRNITYLWDKLQIKDVKEGKVGEQLGRAVTFRNTGISYLRMT